MTKMSDEEIMNEIKIGAAKLNEMLDVGLTEDTYIKTKGYKSQRINKKLKPLIETVDKSIKDSSLILKDARAEGFEGLSSVARNILNGKYYVPSDDEVRGF
jgi:adenylosuccinate synthase